ncbi:MAG: T9SS type A sorting domain-containing protein, partial [Bacteroidetes bacterium]|nr:T9SS type A sorting domain-containing protein [Bacteroidota bacterium]
PPQTGCATQDGWCGAESGIDASVWFTFTATGTEATITTCLDANTIDTQIAAYSATDCTDFGTLALLGANDDAIDGCDLGATAFASVLNLTGLTIGQTYWVLVDGYNGAAGDFAISITQTVGLDEESQVEFGMFPNPADETLWITSSENLESISITDMQGRNVISQAGMFRQVDISNLASGMYQVAVSTGDRVSVQKLIKE